MKNGRARIKQMCDTLNKDGILPFPVRCEGIETAMGKELTTIVNKFMDDIETMSDSSECMVRFEAKVLYNALCEGTVSFEPPYIACLHNDNKDCISIDTDFLFFKRTIYYDESGRKIKEED